MLFMLYIVSFILSFAPVQSQTPSRYEAGRRFLSPSEMYARPLLLNGITSLCAVSA